MDEEAQLKRTSSEIERLLNELNKNNASYTSKISAIKRFSDYLAKHKPLVGTTNDEVVDS
jgi:hypothetical protein